MRFPLFTKTKQTTPDARPDDERTYSSFQIMRALGIERNDFQNWIKGGFIKPTVPSPGRGKPAIFTRQDVYRIGFFREFLEYSPYYRVAARMVELCDHILLDPTEDYVVIERTPPKKWNLTDKRVDTIKNLTEHKVELCDSLLIINIKRLRANINEALKSSSQK